MHSILAPSFLKLSEPFDPLNAILQTAELQPLNRSQLIFKIMELNSGQDRQAKGIRKKRLQCPFTWGIPGVSNEDLARESDILPLAPDTWTLVVNKIYLAYQYAMRDDIMKAKNLITDSYLPLVVLDTKCQLVPVDSELIEKYKIGLKHVIDSTLAFILCKLEALKDLEPFLQTILPFSSMSDTQKSAVWGIRSRLSQHNDGLRAASMAISLNPGEGQWHLYKGMLLQPISENHPALTSEVIETLEHSYHLRASPESAVLHAFSFAERKEKQRQQRLRNIKKSLVLFREVLTRWPDNPFVNFHSGVSVFKLYNYFKEDNLLDLTERCLRKTVKLVGQSKCSEAWKELGAFLLIHGDTAEANMCIKVAKKVQDDTNSRIHT